MYFRVAACVVAFFVLTILFGEVYKIQRVQQESTFEIQRRLTLLETPAPVPVEEPTMCVPLDTGPMREFYPFFDDELDAKDFKKGRRYK